MRKTKKPRPADRPARVIFLDIDGLDRPAFDHALAQGEIPNLARLLGGPGADKGVQFKAVSVAPSITYTCQASSFTGAHPCEHWIPGNNFFDRFGRLNGGKARKYEFDFLDAPAVFMKGLAGEALNPAVETIYESATRHGASSTVAFNMYARGAGTWLKPGFDDWRTFVAQEQGGFGAKYDNAMLNNVLAHLQAGGRPELLTLYFFGLDHESHILGPQVQSEYLSCVIDRQVGRFVDEVERLGLWEDTLFVIFSDHGQVAVKNDDHHALKVGFLFDREMGYVFQALGHDVHDHIFEGANCDALLCPNGGLAYVYLRHKGAGWDAPPDWDETLRTAHAFWEGNASGKYCPDLHGALDLILARNVAARGWDADYQVYTPQGMVDIDRYLADHPDLDLPDASSRLHHLTSPLTGELILLSNYRQGYSFSLVPYRGVHGGLQRCDSEPVLAFGLPTGSQADCERLRGTLREAIEEHCQADGSRQVNNCDLAHGVRAVMAWV